MQNKIVSSEVNTRKCIMLFLARISFVDISVSYRRRSQGYTTAWLISYTVMPQS